MKKMVRRNSRKSRRASPRTRRSEGLRGWMALRRAIRRTDRYVYLVSRSPGPSQILAYKSETRWQDRRLDLQTFPTGDAFRLIPGRSGNKLLLPPRDLAQVDIKAFADNTSARDWERLGHAIRRHWNEGDWLSTHGHGVSYLHIRFEPHLKYDPSGHARL